MDNEKMKVIIADIEDDVDPGEKKAAINRELNEEWMGTAWAFAPKYQAKAILDLEDAKRNHDIWTRNFVPVLALLFWSLFARAQFCEGKQPNIFIHTSCHEVCSPGTYNIDTAFCVNFMMKATGATHYTWTEQGKTVALTDTLYFWPSVPGVTNYTVTGAVYYNGRPCFGTAVISITTTACTYTIDFTTGTIEYQKAPLLPVYFDVWGNRTEKQINTLLIEQAGLKRRKIMITQ